MTSRRPYFSQNADDAANLEALDARFAAEDQADQQEAAERQRLGGPEPRRALRVFDGFADAPTTPKAGP